MAQTIKCKDGSLWVEERLTVDEWVAKSYGAEAYVEGLALSGQQLIATISFPETVFPHQNVKIEFVPVPRDVVFTLKQLKGGEFLKTYFADRDEHGTRVFKRVGTIEHQHVEELNPSQSQTIMNHSPEGFEWAYTGSGPSQLALAILLDVFGDESIALKHYQDFKTRFIANLPVARWTIREDDVRQWIKNAGEGVLL